MSVSADSPLLFPASSSQTPLEKSHLTFVTNVAHQADHIIQLRGLETGVARDVSGVVRVNGRRGWNGKRDETWNELPGKNLEQRDWEGLFYLETDGNVKVWQR